MSGMNSRACERVCVVAFRSTHDAMRAEDLCRAAGVAGRIVPLPVQISAQCGMAWRMPPSERPAFEQAIAQELVPQGIYEMEL